MKARFVCNVSNARLARNRIDQCEGFEAEYIVERVIYLQGDFFISFRSRLLENEPNIASHKSEMFVDENGVFLVLMFCSLQSDIMILVYSDGEDYAKNVSLISNGGEKVKPRFTTSKRYTKKRRTQFRRKTAIK